MILELLLCTLTTTTSTTSEMEEREASIFGDPDERDEAIFGQERGTKTASSADANDIEGALFGGEEPQGEADRISAQLMEKDNILDIGGQLWLRFTYSALSEGGVETFSLRSPNFVDLYLDARPNDRIRGFVQGRLEHDFTVGEDVVDSYTGEQLEQTRVLLDQLWLKFDVLQRVFLTVGRQRMRWGAGRFWNPTDFLNQQRLDPLAIFDQRLGVSLVKLHLPIESHGWNFYAVANVDESDPLERIGGAFRAEILLGQTELTLSTAFRKDDPIRIGADISSGIWWFDVRVEAAVLKRVDTPFYRGSFDVGSLPTYPTEAQYPNPIALGAARLAWFGSLEDAFPSEYSRRDDWIPQVVVGADIQIPFSDEDSITIGAEYFFNDFGYDSAELYPVLLYTGQYTPLYVGRHYAALYAYLAGPGRWDDTTFMLSTLSNLSDRSFVSRFDYKVRVLTYLDLSAWVSVHYGKKGEQRMGFTIPAVAPGLNPADLGDAPLGEAELALLQRGLTVVPPMFDLGFSMMISF